MLRVFYYLFTVKRIVQFVKSPILWESHELRLYIFHFFHLITCEIAFAMFMIFFWSISIFEQ